MEKDKRRSVLAVRLKKSIKNRDFEGLLWNYVHLLSDELTKGTETPFKASDLTQAINELGKFVKDKPGESEPEVVEKAENAMTQWLAAEPAKKTL